MVIEEVVTIVLLLGASAIAVVYARVKFQPRIEIAKKSNEKEIVVLH